MSISVHDFGCLKDGQKAYLYTLENSSGIRIRITNFGGIVVSIETPDRNGDIADITLGYHDLESYCNDTNYFGAIIGRCANRIKNGYFTIDGKGYQLNINDGSHHLHGGINGFNKVLWIPKAYQEKDADILELEYISKDGEEAYPGNATVKVKYILDAHNNFIIHYNALTDKPTLMNLTNHAYYNLAGQGTIQEHLLYINAEKYTPIDKELIPTGGICDVINTPMDFMQLKMIGSNLRYENSFEQLIYAGGFDHNYILKDNNKISARLIEPKSGRAMDIITDLPGIQFYTGNFLDASTKGNKRRAYEKRSALCLETQYYPNAVNISHFPQCVLRPDSEFNTFTGYRFYVADQA